MFFVCFFGMASSFVQGMVVLQQGIQIKPRFSELMTVDIENLHGIFINSDFPVKRENRYA